MSDTERHIAVLAILVGWFLIVNAVRWLKFRQWLQIAIGLISALATFVGIATLTPPLPS